MIEIYRKILFFITAICFSNGIYAESVIKSGNKLTVFNGDTITYKSVADEGYTQYVELEDGYYIDGVKQNSINVNTTEIIINKIHEERGIELGTNSYSKGSGSITTGKNSIALGKDAVATGGNETKETILKKLAENQARLDEIKRKEKEVESLTNELNKLKIRHRATIEAATRVAEVAKSKERARIDWQSKLENYNSYVRDTKEQIDEANRKIEDLNSRLSALSQIQGFNLNSEEGINGAATELKRRVEDGTSLNLTLDFYKDYARNYYKALGDLRENRIKYNRIYLIKYDDFTSSLYENAINTYNNMIELTNETYGFNYSDNLNFRSRNYTSNIKNIVDLPINYDINSDININEYITTEEEWNKVKENIPLYKQAIHKYFEKNNDNRLTPELKNKIDETFDKKLNIVQKKYEITYYQWKYETDNRNTIWLDKKKNASDELNNLLRDFRNWINEEGEVYPKHDYYGDRTVTLKVNNVSSHLYKLKLEWYKNNIRDVEERNRINVNTLTSELEQALGINRNLINEINRNRESKLNISNQAKRNYEGINPSESDLILAREYANVKRQLDEKGNMLSTAVERLQSLRDELTLHDLTNIGEDAIAIGNGTIASGNKSIAYGSHSISTGENAISIGAENLTSATKGIALGTGNVVKGEKNIAIGIENIVNGIGSGIFGDPNSIYGNNNYVIGNDNKVGTDINHSNNIFILGSNIIVPESKNDGVVLGNNSSFVENSVSIGSISNQRQIKFVKEGIDDTDVVNVKQLKDYVAKNGSSIDLDRENANRNIVFYDDTIDNGNGGFVYSDVDENEKILRKNIDIKKMLTSKANLDIPTGYLVTDTMVKAKLDDKSNKDGSNIEVNSFTTKLNEGSNLDNPNNKLVTDIQVKNKLNEKVDKSDFNTFKDSITSSINTNLDNKANKDGSNIEVDSFTTKLNDGSNLDNPNNRLVTDRQVKEKLDLKVDKSELSSINTNLDNKVNKDASNIVVEKFVKKLSENSNIDNPTDNLVTDRQIKEKLDLKVDKSSLRSLTSNDIDILNGENSFYGTKNIELSIKRGSISLDKLDNSLKNSILDLVKIDGSNIKENSGVVNKIKEYLSTDEITEATLNKLTTGAALVKYVDKAVSTLNFDSLNSKFKNIEGKYMAGVASALATASIPQISDNKYVSIGAGVANYGIKQGFAVGISGQNKAKNFLYKLSGSYDTGNNFGVSFGFNVSLVDVDKKENLNKNFEDKLAKLEEKYNNLLEKIDKIRIQAFDLLVLGGYKSDEYILDNKQLEILDMYISKIEGKEVIVTGYADTDGDDKYNLNLGLNRARQVAKYLESKGVILKQTRSLGFNSIIEENSKDKKYFNRRVEIFVIK